MSRPADQALWTKRVPLSTAAGTDDLMEVAVMPDGRIYITLTNAHKRPDGSPIDTHGIGCRATLNTAGDAAHALTEAIEHSRAVGGK